ncbi:hypothetical protein ACO0DA_12105 [Bacillus subtilis]|uniref:hypothetical protein n=1 Tax=Bacillus subtilis group TaxID=653685 RepID=UPI00100A113E|nr:MULTISPECIES: hypothetical protein [Bacillus subtilis group]MCY9397605.1 hypothetical protein [Bacillus inaquosorum]MEC0400817.1 hypothetical protein [Bacillus subtilis]QAW06612.1 hypothetical protein ES968_21855 [Bacillus subtilis]
MDKEIIKDAIVELLGESSYKGRKWFFPKNVDNKYKIFGNVTVKELFTVIAPFFLIAAGVAAIPPYSTILFWIFKFFIVVLLILIPTVYLNYRPIKNRENIRTKDWIKEVIEYRKKQKVFFIEPKNKGVDPF